MTREKEVDVSTLVESFSRQHVGGRIGYPTRSDRISSAKCQMLRILRAVVLAIEENAVVHVSDWIIGSDIRIDQPGE